LKDPTIEAKVGVFIDQWAVSSVLAKYGNYQTQRNSVRGQSASMLASAARPALKAKDPDQ
jgi:hypothetical protein